MNEESLVPQTEKDPRELALNRLSVREYSAGEMRQYLRRKGISETKADETVKQLISENLINDRRYARVIARHQSFRDKGPMYVVNKLRSKGVKLDVREARAMLEDVGQRDEHSAVLSVLSRRFADLGNDRREIQRAFQSLLRRGFSAATVRKCLEEVTKTSQESLPEPSDD